MESDGVSAWRDDEFSDLPAEKWEPLEQRVRDFEAALASRSRPDLADFLPKEDPSNGQLLVELVHADLEFRIAAGEKVRVEDYIARFPELAKKTASLIGLIKAEFEHRSPREPTLRLSEYSSRFPYLLEELNGNGSRLTTRSFDTINDAGVTRPRVQDADETSAEFPSVPGYTLIEEIGRGGMGLVYKAIETKLGRLVALKTVLPGANAVDRVRLRREADAAASLQNPNVVQVYHIFEDAGRLYVSCEFLPGGTLANRVARRPLPPLEAAALLEPIARAVSEAHDWGIIHRDLKPSNILIAADGSPKITDFGLSKWIDEDTSLTRTGIVAGSPSYMAPEQAVAHKDIGPAVDIWALGAILYELLTGRPPFQAATVLDTLEQVRNNEPIPPRKLVPRVPRDLETICLKCLEKNPQRRYRTAQGLAEDLARFQRGEIVQARPVGLIGRTLRSARRRPAIAALLFVVMVSSSLASAGLFYHNGVLSQTIEDRDEALRSESEARNKADAARLASQASEQRMQRLLFVSDMTQVAKAVENADLRRAEELLQLHRGEATGDYAFVWNYLDRLVHAPGRTVDQLAGAGYFVCFSPGGGLLAACGEAGEVSLYDSNDWTLKSRFSTGQGELNGLAFTRDGKHLLTAGDDGTVALWDLELRKEILRRKVFEQQAYQVAFGMKDALLAVCGNDPAVVFLNASTFEEIARLTVDAKHVEGLAATPDGKTLVAAGRSGTAVAFDFSTQEVRWKHQPDVTDVEFMSVTISPDGKLAAFGSRRSTISLADIETGSIHSTTLSGSALGDDASWYRAACFLPRGDALAVASDAGVVHIAGIVDGTVAPLGDHARPAWTAHSDRITCITAREDILVTVSRDGTISAWEPDANRAWRKIPLPGNSGVVTGLPSSDGLDTSLRLVAVGSDFVDKRPTTHLIDTESPAYVIPIAGESHWRDVASSRDGKRLFAGGHENKIAGWDVDGPALTPLFERSLPELTTAEIGGVTHDGERFAVHFWWENPHGESETELHIIDGNTGETLASRRFWHGMPSAAFAEDGSLVFVVQERELLMLEPDNLKTRRKFLGHEDKVMALQLSRDARLLASAGNDREVIVWEIASGKMLHRWQADTGQIASIAFSPGSHLLLTSTQSRPLRLWDIQSGRLQLELGVSPEAALLDQWSPAEFTAEGTRIIAGSGRSALLIDGSPLSTLE